MKLFSSLLVIAAVLSCTANPLKFPEYRQTLTLTFQTPDQRDAAEVKILPLPCGKKTAYTARWDDTNPANLKMGELLKKHGMKGTFMLHGTNFREQGQQLLKQGHAIGNHTEHHYWLPLTTPNQIFYEIAVYQIKLETELQTCVVSHVFPFGSGSDLFKDFPGTCVRVFDCANLYVFPFYWKNANQYFKRPESSLFSTSLFTSNDRNPTKELFRTNLEKTLKNVNPAFQRVTHGIHVWMTPNGFDELDQAFAEVIKNQDLVFLTENEYGAYHYSFLHAGLRKSGNGTNSISYELTRFSPGHLGSGIPLSVQITPAPLRAELNGIQLARDGNGFWLLPHDPGKNLPEIFEWLKDSREQSERFPGLKFEFNTNDTMTEFSVRLTNQTGKDLKDLHLQLSLPPKWNQQRQTVSADLLGNGNSKEWTFDAGKVSEDPDFSEGIYWMIARLDFDGGRIYRTITRKGTEAGDGIHSLLRHLGPFPKEALGVDLVQKLSLPGILEPVIWDGKRYLWKQYRSSEFNRYSFDLRDRAYQDRSLVCPAVAEFIMPEDGDVKIAMYHGTEFYCNGEFVGKQRRHYTVKAKKGRNRLFFPHAANYESIVIFPPGKLIAPEEK